MASCRRLLPATVLLGFPLGLLIQGSAGPRLAADSRAASSGQRKAAVDLRSEVRDLDGRPVDPFADKKAKAVVFVFVCADCPVSNGYAPLIEQMYEAYRAKGVAFWLVYADPSEGAAKIRDHLKDYRYHVPAVRDPEHRLVELCKARKTPEAVLFAPGGKLAYRGRIDDRYTDYGKSRRTASRHDLRNAIDAVLTGKEVPVGVTEPVGCFIPSRTP